MRIAVQPGLDAAEACRRITAALKVPCAFDADVATINLEEPAVIDRGELAGRNVTRAKLTLRDGLLARIALQVEGFTTDQVFVAPPR